MKNSQLITVLKTFTKKEQREFTKWLASPFFNQRDDVVKLFLYLIKRGHLEEEKYLAKERIYKKLFSPAHYDDAKFRQTAHFLLKQLEQYLAYKEIEEDEFSHPVAFLKAIRKRKLANVFQKKFNALKKQGLGSQQLDSNNLKHSFALYDEYSSLLVGIDRTKDIQLQNSINAFDTHFIAEKLKHACLAFSHEKVFKIKYESKFLSEILATVETSPDLLKFPAIALYYYGFLIQKQSENSDEHYFSLKDELLKHAQIFKESEQRDLYLMALNYCIQRMNKGSAAFVREAFEMYRELIESKIIMENDVLSRWTYLNAALIALRLKEFDWVEQLISNYTSFLHSKYQVIFSNFCKAKLRFEQGDYQEAMRLLVHFESNDFLVSLNAKSMLLKMFYEQDDIDPLESLLESMRIYLRRKEVIGYHKANYQNIVTYTRKLARLNPYDKEKRMQLRTEIEEASPLTERPWLLEQIDKLS